MTSEFSKYSFLRDFNFAQLDKRIAVQQASLIDDGLGGWMESWQEVYTTWAKFINMSNLRNTDLYSEKLKYCIIMRYNPIITPGLRLSYRGVGYAINEVINIQNNYMIITTTEDLYV